MSDQPIVPDDFRADSADPAPGWRAGEKFTRLVLDAVPAHIAVIDHDANIIAVNERWTRFATENGDPDPRAVSVGANYIEACRAGAAPTDLEAQAAIDAIEMAFATGSSLALEYPCHSPHEQRWFLMQATRLPAEVGGAVVTHLSITARKQAELAMRRARDDADAANRAKDDFLATVSHELRTPIATMLLWADLLRRDSLSRPDQDEALGTLVRCAQDQSRLVDDLLDASRLGHGKVRVLKGTMNLRQVVQAAADAIGLDARAKNVELRCALRDATLCGDATLLRRVAANLLANALKFTPPGGAIDVTVEATPSHAVFEVVDTGQGITAEFLPYLFDPFRQADACSTRRYGGLGLGLSIARQLVSLHGGSIVARSAGPGKGARFTVLLPIGTEG